MSDTPEFVTTISIVDNASSVLESIEAAAKRAAGVFDMFLGIERNLGGFVTPIEDISSEMLRMAEHTNAAEDAIRDLDDSLGDMDNTAKKLSLGDIFGKVVSNGANILSIIQMGAGLLDGFQASMKTVDANTNMIARLGQVARKEGIAMEDKEAWQGRAEEIRKMLAAQAIDLGLNTTEYANNAITFANNPAFSGIEEASRFSELMSKQFFASGVGGQAQMSVINQLTQGLGKGKLQGEDLMSILSNAPDVGKLLEEAYARLNNLDVETVTGKVRDLAGEGKLTADVIKDAFFGAAETIETNFEEMPNTFEDMLTKFKGTVNEAMQPIMQLLSQIGNSDSFKSVLNSLSSIISNAIKFVSIFSPVLDYAMLAVSKGMEFLSIIIDGQWLPWNQRKSKTAKETPSERIAASQREKMLQTMQLQTDLMRNNTDAIHSLADIQKTFNERTKDLFNYSKDLEKRQEEWLKDYQHREAENNVNALVEQANSFDATNPVTNEEIEEWRKEEYAKIQQGSIFNREQLAEAEDQYRKAMVEVDGYTAVIEQAKANIENLKASMESYGVISNFDSGILGDMAANIAQETETIQKLTEYVAHYQAIADAQKEGIDLYRSRMDEWNKQIAANTEKTARNTRKVSINRDDLLFMKNIATAQIINNYNSNTNTANFNQNFGSASPTQVRKASADGFNIARRGSSSATAG